MLNPIFSKTKISFQAKGLFGNRFFFFQISEMQISQFLQGSQKRGFVCVDELLRTEILANLKHGLLIVTFQDSSEDGFKKETLLLSRCLPETNLDYVMVLRKSCNLIVITCIIQLFLHTRHFVFTMLINPHRILCVKYNMQPQLRKLKLREVRQLAQHYPAIIVRPSCLLDCLIPKLVILRSMIFCLQYIMFAQSLTEAHQ